MNRLSYKGYFGDAQDNTLHGRVLNIHNIYEGHTVDEIKAHFVEAVEGYLKMCDEQKVA